MPTLGLVFNLVFNPVFKLESLTWVQNDSITLGYSIERATRSKIGSLALVQI
jgi:hypothetical protein